VGSFVAGGRNRKGWFRIGAINMEILFRRLDLPVIWYSVSATRNFAIIVGTLLDALI